MTTKRQITTKMKMKHYPATRYSPEKDVAIATNLLRSMGEQLKVIMAAVKVYVPELKKIDEDHQSAADRRQAEHNAHADRRQRDAEFECDIRMREAVAASFASALIRTAYGATRCPPGSSQETQHEVCVGEAVRLADLLRVKLAAVTGPSKPRVETSLLNPWGGGLAPAVAAALAGPYGSER